MTVERCLACELAHAGPGQEHCPTQPEAAVGSAQRRWISRCPLDPKAAEANRLAILPLALAWKLPGRDLTQTIQPKWLAAYAARRRLLLSRTLSHSALTSNIGTYHQSEWTIVPEFELRIGYQFTSCVQGFIGYSLLYWDRLARSGNQIDLTVNSTLIPPITVAPVGALRPAFSFQSSDFWAEGLEFGVEVRF